MTQRPMTQRPITHVATTDLSEMLNPVGPQRMSLPGFDTEFVDFPDYIIRITDRIWHERDVDKIYDYYARDCIVHTQLGTIIGVQPVVDGTHATMKSFPDRVLDADNVIWSKNDPQEGSENPVFYSSHLITSKMTNLGPSEFGSATGNKIRVITLADCACRDNVIFEEWLVRDYAAIVLQMGFDVSETALKLAQQDVVSGKDIAKEHESNIRSVRQAQALSRVKPSVPEEACRDFAESFFGTIWQDQDFSRLSEFYDFRVRGQYPGNQNLYGPEQIQATIRPLLEILSDIKVSVAHVCDLAYLGDSRDVAIRWSLVGKHTGEGSYGQPTGEDVYVLGVSQFRLIKGRIKEDVTIWDDVALRRMIDGIRLRQKDCRQGD